jgi:hypothetical protein
MSAEGMTRHTGGQLRWVPVAIGMAPSRRLPNRVIAHDHTALYQLAGRGHTVTSTGTNPRTREDDHVNTPQKAVRANVALPVLLIGAVAFKWRSSTMRFAA